MEKDFNGTKWTPKVPYRSEIDTRGKQWNQMDKIRENSCVVLKGTMGMYDTLATPCHNTSAKGMPFETLNSPKSGDFSKVLPWKP